jgi:hypothetical protein
MRPLKNDYAPYYDTYISKVAGEYPDKILELQFGESEKFFKELDNDTASLPYAEGKWTYKQALGHIIDTERVMSYRALCIARGETKALPGFDQNLYVNNGSFDKRSWENLREEYKLVRDSSLILFDSFTKDDFIKRGIASENNVTVLALLYIIAGHDKHHLEVLKSYFRKL